ncbi:MAG: glycosyltransferase family 2 protein [Candidatus Omnitrophica bacterium]|nr:glycosyltransferase family 2 protein [Candidatus Omnitrophota bacterium]
MKLSVIIPVYNEINTIGKVLDDLIKLDLGFEKEIIVVDDCSSDGTKEFLSEIKNDCIRVLFCDQNCGKANAIKVAQPLVTGDIVIIQDADLEYPPLKNYKILIDPILDGHADVVYGSRFLGVHRVFFCWHYLANKFLTALANVLYDTMLSDMETGVKAFRRDVFSGININASGFCFEPEITAKIFKRGCRVYEVPITYYGRSYKEGKKIKPIDGVKAIITLFKYRFVD